MNNNQETADVRGPSYAGAQACVSCHKEICNGYLANAHANTSKPANAKSVKGNFSPSQNTFVYNDSEKVIVQQANNHFYQTRFVNNTKRLSEPFDIVVGSGRKVQTYLYRKDDQIYELPLSYMMNPGSWVNSPGFPASHPYFDRNIPSACFGCHGSAANTKLDNTNSLDAKEKYLPGQILLGIDCERCHGPARQHVDYQTAHPNDKEAKFITSIAKLSRTQQTDMCAICHSGVKQSIQPIFSFKPGDKLENYYFPEYIHRDAGSLDVHGTQVQTIMASLCYQKSNTLTCTTCHNPHQSERDNIVLFSQRCMTCHSEGHNFCTNTTLPAEALKVNCIDCHMPSQSSRVVQMLSNTTDGQKLQPDYIRTHLITIYPDEAKRVTALWKTTKK